MVLKKRKTTCIADSDLNDNSEAIADTNDYPQMQMVLPEEEMVLAGIVPANCLEKSQTRNIMNKLAARFSILTGKKDEQNELCPYRPKVSKNSRNITIDCSECKHESSMENTHCRNNIFEILRKEPAVERLTLANLYERDYEGRSLASIYLMAGLQDKLTPYRNSRFTNDNCDNSILCKKEHSRIMDSINSTAGN